MLPHSEPVHSTSNKTRCSHSVSADAAAPNPRPLQVCTLPSHPPYPYSTPNATTMAEEYAFHIIKDVLPPPLCSALRSYFDNGTRDTTGESVCARESAGGRE